MRVLIARPFPPDLGWCDAPPILEPCEAVLDLVALEVSGFIMRHRKFAAFPGRGARGGAPIFIRQSLFRQGPSKAGLTGSRLEFRVLSKSQYRKRNSPRAMRLSASVVRKHPSLKMPSRQEAQRHLLKIL